MAYYHVFINYKDQSDKISRHATFGYNKKRLMEKIVIPYNKSEPFMFHGVELHRNKIVGIQIFLSTVKSLKEIILPDGKPLVDKEVTDEIVDLFSRKKIPTILGDVTDDFLLPEKEKDKFKDIDVGEKNKSKIFIAHGADEASALLLKNHLIKKGIDAEMFEDFKDRISGNTTVIEELMKIKDETIYAFIVATPDDLGNSSGEIENYINGLVKSKSTFNAKDVCDILEKLNFRARQNVLFEYGLFLGVLGREKVQCLWNKKIGEEPSDIKGVLNIQFEKSIRETYSEIDAKLEKLRLIKK